MSALKKRKSAFKDAALPAEVSMSTKEFVVALRASNAFAFEQVSSIRPLGLTAVQLKKLQEDVAEHNALPGVADIVFDFKAVLAYRDKYMPVATLHFDLFVDTDDQMGSADVDALVDLFAPYMINKDGAAKLRKLIVERHSKPAKVEPEEK